MTEILRFILALIVWSVLGGIPCIIWCNLKFTSGWELCNPYWLYHYHTSVNWFGAIALSLLFMSLCPIGAISYWFYKLCTVGRR